MSAPIECVKCGSVLRQGVPGEILTCKFCSAETRVPDDVPRAVVVAGRPPRPANNGIAVAVIGGTLALIGIGIGIVVIAKRSPPPRPAPVVTFTPPLAPPPKPLMKPSEVGKLAELLDPAWEEIDPSEMGTTFSNFDFLAVLPFAIKIAKFWAQDAEFADVALEGITPDGKLDLSAHEGWHAAIDFSSRAMFAAQEKLREVGEKKVYTMLLFDVSQGKVKVELGRGGDLRQLTKQPTFECPQASVVAAFKTIGLAPRPTYTLRARYDYTSQWVWSAYAEGGPSPQQTLTTTASCKVVR